MKQRESCTKVGFSSAKQTIFSPILHIPISHFLANLRLLQISQDLLTLGSRRLKVADHVESPFRQVISLAVDDLLEAGDGVLEIDELALDTGEDLCDGEWLA